MKTVDRLPELAARLGLADDAAARRELGEFLHQVVHDLNNPMGTFSIEFYSLGLMAQQLQGAIAAGDLERAQAAATALAEIQDNLQGAQATAMAILEALDAHSVTLSGGEDA